jgi:hypothetical protein
VKLFAVRAALMKDTITDANGRFKFDKMFIGDSLKFTLQARTPDNTDKVIITLDTLAQMNVQVTLRHNKNTADADIIKTHLKKAAEEGKPVDLSGMHVLKQVDIKANKITAVKEDLFPQSILRVREESADKVITISDPEQYNDLAMALQARLPGVSIQGDGMQGYQVMAFIDMRTKLPMKVVLNGRLLDSHGEVDEILQGALRPGDIDKILMVKTNRAAVASLGGDENDGFILITTKVGAWRKGYNPSIANIIPKGFNKVRKFYSPRYNNPEIAKNTPDFRTTIYWNPYVGVDTTGKASFDFFNADGPTNYRIVIEGINAAGEIGRQVYRYKVE